MVTILDHNDCSSLIAYQSSHQLNSKCERGLILTSPLKYSVGSPPPESQSQTLLQEEITLFAGVLKLSSVKNIPCRIKSHHPTAA